MINPFLLEGKTILIAGATAGIGRATAVQCVEIGADVVLIGRNESSMASLVSELGPEKAKGLLVDLTHEHSVEKIVPTLPKLDGIVCNAGSVLSLSTRQIASEDIESLFKINTFSHIKLTQLLIEHKKINKEASIVFTSSMSGVYCGIPGGGLYGATKSALAGFSKALALELAPRGIRVNTVHPGMVETSLCDRTAISKDLFIDDANKYPLGRYGRPEEIAYAIIFLLSDATKWMTGSQLLIDGGYCIK